MGSRYDDSYRSSLGRGPPPGERWDSLRFNRESEDRYRGPPPPPPPPVMERERERGYDSGPRYDDPYPARASRPTDRFDDRYHREEQYGPPARRPERRYYDDDDFYSPRGPPSGDAMIPYRPQRPQAPPRLLRRQSSLDTFDRRPMRRPHHMDDYDDFRPNDHRPPPVIPIPVPPSRSPPRYSRPRYAERDYDDIRIAEPDYFGDEEFRGYREREWTRQRSRHRSVSSSSSSDGEVRRHRNKTYPRKGKTRMPKRLAHTKILIDLGYPYHEEGEMIIIEKALGKENIDEVVTLSREWREKEGASTIHVIKSPPPEEKKTEEIVERKIVTVPISDAPRSVREWDNLKVESADSSVSRSKSKRRSRSRHVSRSRRSSSPREVVEKKTIIRDASPGRHRRRRSSSPKEIVEKTIIRDVSPGRHRSHSRHTSHGHPVEYVERRGAVDDDYGESNSIHAGPLALVVDRHPKSERDVHVREEIRALEAERRAIRNERVEIHKPSRYKEEDREIIVARPAAEEVIEVKKDKKAPDPRLLRAMLATVT